MRKLGVVMLIMGICLFPLNAKAEYDLAEYFPLDQGNRWVYLVKYGGEEEATLKETVTIEGVEKVDGRETIKMFTSIEGHELEKDKGYFCIFMDAEGVKAYKYMADDGYTDYEPYLLLFPAQLKTGEIRECSNSLTEYEIDKATPVTGDNKKTFILEGLEDITTKSKVFRECLRFSIYEITRYANKEFEISDWTIWLAPNIGKVKEIRTSTGFYIDDGEAEESSELELESAVIRGEKIGK